MWCANQINKPPPAIVALKLYNDIAHQVINILGTHHANAHTYSQCELHRQSTQCELHRQSIQCVHIQCSHIFTHHHSTPAHALLDSIYRIFDGTASRTESREQRENNHRLLGILESNEACSDTSLGFPCCISAHCMFTTVRLCEVCVGGGGWRLSMNV